MLKRISFIVLMTPIWIVGVILTIILLFFIEFIIDIVKCIIPMLNSFMNIVTGNNQ